MRMTDFILLNKEIQTNPSNQLRCESLTTHSKHSNTDQCRPEHKAISSLTAAAGNLESIVEEDAVPRRVARVEDLPVLHHDLGVQGDPPPAGGRLLSGREGETGTAHLKYAKMD